MSACNTVLCFVLMVGLLCIRYISRVCVSSPLACFSIYMCLLPACEAQFTTGLACQRHYIFMLWEAGGYTCRLRAVQCHDVRIMFTCLEVCHCKRAIHLIFVSAVQSTRAISDQILSCAPNCFAWPRSNLECLPTRYALYVIRLCYSALASLSKLLGIVCHVNLASSGF